MAWYDATMTIPVAELISGSFTIPWWVMILALLAIVTLVCLVVFLIVRPSKR
jgi:flagellar biogenesis protein FliO